jgi:hypothetical protein
VATSQQSVPVPLPAGGVRPDLLSDQLPLDALAASENWIFRDGGMRTRNGLSAFAGSVSQRPTGYVFYPHNDGATRLVKATTGKWFQYASGVWTDITGSALSGGPQDQQVFRVFDKGGVKYLLGVNGANTMKKWNGTAATYSDVGGTPPRARCMMIISDRILLGNLLSGVGGAVAGGSSYDISANIDFDSGWGATLSGILADTPGDITAMVEMGGLRGVIYKSDAIYMVTATGGVTPIAIELRQAGVEGPISPAAVARLSDGLHIYLAQDGSLMQFDGVNPSTLGYPIQKYIASTVDFKQIKRSFLMWDSERKELHVVYAENGFTDPNVDVVISFPSLAIWPQRWASLRMGAGAKLKIAFNLTIGDLTGTLGSQTKTLGEFGTESRALFLGEIGGQSYQESGATDAGSPIGTFFETGLSDLGAPKNFKTLSEVDHVFDRTAAAQLVTVKTGASDYGEARTLDAGQSLDVGEAGPYITGHRRTARRHSLRLEASASQPIVWHGASASLALRGLR